MNKRCDELKQKSPMSSSKILPHRSTPLGRPTDLQIKRWEMVTRMPWLMHYSQTTRIKTVSSKTISSSSVLTKPMLETMFVPCDPRELLPHSPKFMEVDQLSNAQTDLAEV